jgi:hypothetical protein
MLRFALAAKGRILMERRQTRHATGAFLILLLSACGSNPDKTEITAATPAAPAETAPPASDATGPAHEFVARDAVADTNLHLVARAFGE